MPWSLQLTFQRLQAKKGCQFLYGSPVWHATSRTSSLNPDFKGTLPSVRSSSLRLTPVRVRANSELRMNSVCLNWLKLGKKGGCNIEGECERWDFGVGAGFYVDATEGKWKEHFNMYSYVNEEVIRVSIFWLYLNEYVLSGTNISTNIISLVCLSSF